MSGEYSLICSLCRKQDRGKTHSDIQIDTLILLIIRADFSLRRYLQLFH
jgi:hypothetical protein